MAERIVSPGVFIREKDQSYLASGIANLGGAIIGPTFEGPALVPTLVSSFNEYVQRFGALLGTVNFDATKHHYTDEAVNSYFEGSGVGGPSLTVVRVLGTGGYAMSSSILLSVTSSTATSASLLLLPTSTGSVAFAGGISSVSFASGSEVSGAASTGSNASFILIVSGTGAIFSASVSLDNDANNYITKVLGSSPSGEKAFYVAVDFKQSNEAYSATASLVVTSSVHTYIQSGSAFDDTTVNYGFTKARTPWLQNNGASKNLFKFFTISDGDSTNQKFKIQIENLKYYSVEERYRFDVVVKDYANDTDSLPSELERFTQVSCDSNDERFIARVIGDKYFTLDINDDRSENGTFPNKSRYIYVSMNTDSTTGDYVAQKSDYPWGFGVVLKPINASVPPPQYITSTLSGGDVRVHFGWEHSGSGDSLTPNKAYLATPVVTAVTDTAFVEGTDVFSMNSVTANGTAVAIADLSDTTRTPYLKFSIPLQGGFDGEDPYTVKKIGTSITAGNFYGFDLSGGSTKGTKLYKAAIDAISDPDEIDINLIVLPGIIKNLHSTLIDYLVTKVEARADCFAIVDPSVLAASIATALSDVNSLDTSYLATYFPWVRMGLRYVPPSVAVIGAYTQSDRLSEAWYAPAGLNRGGLASFGVTDVKLQLSHDNRDTLYEGRVNPIARFASQTGTPQVVVYGQKTLQQKASALDRVNVRRLVISLKKFIASASRFLVFEQNTTATRQKFLNIVNPYMETVQQKSGLTAFKVIMDESNNPADVIDRNQLVGQIYIQPTRTAEFIILDFVVLPTGATFPTA